MQQITTSTGIRAGQQFLHAPAERDFDGTDPCYRTVMSRPAGFGLS